MSPAVLEVLFYSVHLTRFKKYISFSTARRQLKSSSDVCQNRHRTYQYYLYQIVLHYCNEKIGIFKVIIGLFNKTNAPQRKK